MTSPGSNAYKDTYRNALRYTGQNYRFVPTFLRQRDPAAPQAASTDVKPFEMQGYYPVNSLWTNTTNRNVWLLRGISNGLGDWVQIGGGGGGPPPSIQAGADLVPPFGGIFTFDSPGGTVTFSGNPATGIVHFDATLAVNKLEFGVDFTAAGAPNGSVFPVNQKVYVKGNDPIVGTFGIVTQANQTGFPNDTIYIKYSDGAVTTLGNVATPVASFNTRNNESNTVTIVAIGRDVVTGKSFGSRITVIFTNVAGVVTIESEIENISGGTPPMDGCSISLSVIGTFVLVLVRGLAATTINWHILVPVIASRT